MADTTTIGTQGHFGTVTDRIASIATQGHFLVVDVAEVVRVFIRPLADKYSLKALKDKYDLRALGDKYSVKELDNE